MQMQGLVNTLADLRGALAAVDRVNTVVGTRKVDESLALGLELDNSDDHAKIVQKAANDYVKWSGYQFGLTQYRLRLGLVRGCRS